MALFFNRTHDILGDNPNIQNFFLSCSFSSHSVKLISLGFFDKFLPLYSVLFLKVIRKEDEPAIGRENVLALRRC